MKRTSTFLIGIILLATAMLAGHATAQTCVVPPPGLVSWWPGDGNADDIQSGNDGTLLNGAGFAPGMVGDAFSLDGIDDVVSVTDDPTLNNTGEISLAFWVSTNQPLGQTGDLTTDHQYLVDKRQGFGNARGYTFCFDCFASGEISFGFGDGSSRNHVTSRGLSITAGTFHFFVGTASKSEDFVRIYQDGLLIARGSWGGLGTVTNNNPLFIGRPNGCCGLPLGVLKGVIDEVQLFGRALTVGEIEAEFFADSAGKCKPPTIDHFVCYDVKIPKDLPPFDPLEVTLSDQFGDAVRLVKKPKSLCTPVDKNGEGILDVETHLTCYEIKEPEGDSKLQPLKVEVLVNNQFGDEQFLIVEKPKRLCVPSTKELVE